MCARCGNFMCAACAQNGTESQCPTCRQLNPIGFPYDANADLGTLWSHSWDGFQREAAMCVVAGLIFFAFALGGALVSNIITSVVNSILGIKFDPANPLRNLTGFGLNLMVSQVVSMGVNLVVQGIAMVGLYRVLMDVLVGKKADLARMFSQLEVLPHYVLLHLAMFFFITVPTLIYFVLVGVIGLKLVGSEWSQLQHLRPEKLFSVELVGFMLVALLIYLAAMVVVLPVSLFATPELIVGRCNAVEAVKRAWELGNGQRLRTFGYSFIAGVLVILGVLACCVGVIVALPVASMLILALFLALRRSSSLPPAIHT